MKKEHEKVLLRAKEHRKLSYDADFRNRKLMLDDLRFAALDQWPEEVRRKRKGRPTLTLDKTNQVVKRIVGDMRENKPSIKVVPVDSGADKDTAEVISGLINQIEQQSSAINAYMNAAQFQVKCGYGVWRVAHDYASHDVFEQDIMIKLVKNPLNWWFDPSAQEPTKHDGRFCIGIEEMSIDDFKEQFGDDYSVDFDTKYTGEGAGTWITEDTIIVAEYYEKVPIEKEISLLSNGDVIEFSKLSPEEISAYDQQGVYVVRSRKVDSYEMHYYKLTGNDVLESEVLPFRYYPVIPVYGEVENIEGDDHIRGLIRSAKEAQELYNYWQSSIAERISLQPKAPFILTAQQISKYKGYWDKANEENYPYLPYEADPQAPPPQRQAPAQIESGMLQQANYAAEDIKAAMGVYDASVGANSAEKSGVAIARRDQNAELTNNLYLFNLAQAIEHTGKVIIDMLPYIYDTTRVLKIVGDDGVEKETIINQSFVTADGQGIKNDLTRGKYDVRTSVGPSYKTRRIEGAQTLLEIIRVFPQIQQVAGDILAKNLDIPGADELEKRLRKILPPGLIEEDDPAVLEQQQKAAQIQQQQLQLETAKALAEIEQKKAQAEENKAGAVLDLSKAQTEQIQNQQFTQQQIALVLQQLLAQAANQGGFNSAAQQAQGF